MKVAIPWSVLKWNLTQKRSPAAFTHWKVCEPKPSMQRCDAGMPRSPKSHVNWCVASGEWREEVPHVLGFLPVRVGVLLLRVDEVGNLIPSRMKEDRGVVADEIPVAVLGVVTSSRSRAGRAPRPARRARRATVEKRMNMSVRLPTFSKTRIFVHVGTSALVTSRYAVGAGAHRVDDAFGNPLAVEPRELLDQVLVLQQGRAAAAGGLRVLVVGDGGAALGREDRVCHGFVGR